MQGSPFKKKTINGDNIMKGTNKRDEVEKLRNLLR